MNLERYLKKKFKEIQDEATLQIMDKGNKIAEQSLYECPKDTGALRESQKMRINGKVVKRGGKPRSVRRENTITLTIGYNTEYALRQHEDLTYNHPHPGTKAKYLTDPLHAHKSELENDLKEAINKIVRNR